LPSCKLLKTKKNNFALILFGVSLGLNLVGLDRICERWIIAFSTLTPFGICTQWSLDSCDLNIAFPKSVAFYPLPERLPVFGVDANRG
jgi:hypothetical protein